MKKRIVALITGLLLCCMLISGCAATSFVYEDYHKYTAATGATLSVKVDRLDIGWISGSVEILSHDEDTVTFAEETNAVLDEDNTLHYWLEGSTLHIKFAASGKLAVRPAEKHLTVYLPAGTECREIDVDTVSANIKVDSAISNELSVDTVSGNVELLQMQVKEELDANLVSGDLQARLQGPVEELKVNTVSGEIHLQCDGAEDVEVDSVSGDVELVMSAGANDVECGSVSGNVDLSFGKEPDILQVGTVSGRVKLQLPADAGFRADVETASGSVYSEFSMQMDGDRYICADGSGRYEIETSSGNVHIGILP